MQMLRARGVQTDSLVLAWFKLGAHYYYYSYYYKLLLVLLLDQYYASRACLLL